MKNKTTITVETWKQTVVRKNRQNALFCRLCGTETRIYTPHEAASLAQITMRELCGHIESGTFHFIETTEAELFVCGRSLLDKSELPVIRLASRL